MEMNYNFDTQTFMFKTLFPDFETFGNLRDTYIANVLSASIDEQQQIFKLLYNNFCNCSVAYDTPTAFYRHFFIEYQNSVDEYVNKLKLIKTIREMPLDDIYKELESINNMAHNDNAIVNNPLSEIIPYISTQATSVSRGNKLTALHRAISIYRDNEVTQFLDRFKKLFLFLHGDKKYYFCSKEGY